MDVNSHRPTLLSHIVSFLVLLTLYFSSANSMFYVALLLVSVYYIYYVFNIKALMFDNRELRKNINTYDSSYSKYDLHTSLTHSPQMITDTFYNLVTDFYEYGWGDSFHFAPRYKGESFKESIARHEYFLAKKLNMNPGEKVLDMGSGVGGPMRRIAKFTGSSITGVTLNEYQVRRCQMLTPNYLKPIAQCIQGDFTNLVNLADESFDKVFSIEAHCHVNPRLKVYKEAFRVLKKGGYLATYDWVMTDKFEPNNEHHLKIKRGIEHGDGLPDLIMPQDILKDAELAGFEIVEHFDVNKMYEEIYKEGNVPWYFPLQASFSIEGWKATPIGRKTTTGLLTCLEALKVMPKGSVATAKMLEDGAENLVKAGELKIFTPMYFFLYRKKL